MPSPPRGLGARHLLNEVLSLNAQESRVDERDLVGLVSSMKS